MEKLRELRLRIVLPLGMALLIMLLLLRQGSGAYAELPPDAYRQMQSRAPEFIYLHVLMVNVRPVQDGQNIDVTAKVVVVKRTRTHLLAGNIIHLSYFHRTRLLIGPGPVPVLATGQQYPAFLAKVVGQNIYKPVAGAMSFDVLK